MKLLLGITLSSAFLFASIDINHADSKELVKLNGVGEAKALRIVQYIKQNGCFKSLDDITSVKGIGKGILLKNKDMIKIVSCEKKEDQLKKVKSN